MLTKQNITIANGVLGALFLITLVAVAIPLVKNEGTASLFTETRRAARSEPSPPPEPQQEYACPKHPDVRTTAPGKCPQCGSDLVKAEGVERFTAIARRDLFDAHLTPPKVVEVPPPEPLRWELAGMTKIGLDYVATIRDKSRRVAGGFQEYSVREGDEVPGYIGVTIMSITPSPAVVTYERAGVGMEELKMGESALETPAAQKAQWSEIIRPMREGYTYVVSYRELLQRIPSAEVYRQTFDVEPVTEGVKVVGLRITRLTPDNLLYAGGLRQGDVIDSINMRPITDEASVLEQLRAAAAEGFTVRLGVARGRTPRTIVYTLHNK